MLQPSHRGIYEYLWSEHKLCTLAVSIKVFQGMTGKLGRRPQILKWLRRLAVLAGEERPELYNALLNAYMAIKPFLARKQRHQLIETILADKVAASELIYQHTLTFQEKSLYGCRLFFKGTRSLYKFWDAQDRPGLWLCFGPFQLHLTPRQIMTRLICKTELSSDDLHKRLTILKKGISEEEFLTWPGTLRQQLIDNNLVALPGHSAFLHPRAEIITDCEAALEVDLYTAAALVLEKLWDNAEFPDDVLAELPQHNDFVEAFQADFLPEVIWQKSFCSDEAWDFIAGMFWRQKCQEAGQPKAEIEAEELPGIRMEPADQKVDSEECEHGDEEADN